MQSVNTQTDRQTDCKKVQLKDEVQINNLNLHANDLFLT